jgi:hypothetical protein
VILIRDGVVAGFALEAYRLLLLAHTVQNLSLNPSSGFALFCEILPSDTVCSSTALLLTAPGSCMLSSDSGGGGGGGGGIGLRRGSEAIVMCVRSMGLQSQTNMQVSRASSIHWYMYTITAEGLYVVLALVF